MAREFECRRAVELPAPPEAVWDAVATDEGNAAWLFPGALGPDDPAVRVWDPPRHLAVRQEEGDWFNELDFVIERGERARTALRYRHHGVFVGDQDDRYDLVEGVQQHTDFYLRTLAEYLAHFAGRTATYVGDGPQGINGPEGSATPDGFARLLDALTLPAEAGAGDRVALRPAGLPPADGVVYERSANFCGVRTDDALCCFFGRNAFGAPVAVSVHAFAAGVDAAAAGEVWPAWLAEAVG